MQRKAFNSSSVSESHVGTEGLGLGRGTEGQWQIRPGRAGGYAKGGGGWQGTQLTHGADRNWEWLGAFQGLAPTPAATTKDGGLPGSGQGVLGEDAVRVWPILSPKARAGRGQSWGREAWKPGWEPHHPQEALPNYLCRAEYLKQRGLVSCTPQLEPLFLIV